MMTQDSLDKKYLSNTSITFKIISKWFCDINENKQREIIKEMCTLLSENKVAYDINGYAKAPPSFRVWAGGTVESNNIELLLPWLDWAYYKIKESYA